VMSELEEAGQRLPAGLSEAAAAGDDVGKYGVYGIFGQTISSQECPDTRGLCSTAVIWEYIYSG
jgi:hypothetical protein